jgi:16S rRNA (cytosine1402-N4)-methyltransferase
MDESPRESQHIPVMLGPVIELLGCKAGGIYVDGTIGAGGYARCLLDKSAPDGIVLGLDWDSEAIERVRATLGGHAGKLILEKSDFADIRTVLYKHGIRQVDGIVVDLGVSSFQIEDPRRGFSFMNEGPLDMRMNLELTQTAADLVNTLAEKDMADLIHRYGEDRQARRIARAIVAARKMNRMDNTRELANLIRKAVPRTKDSFRIHPATRTFQALRIAVNHELDSLHRFLPEALGVLKDGGRLCVVAFHSLEDRIVKEAFRTWARSCRCPRELAACECGGRPLVRPLTKKALRPSPDEIELNPRARSAKLRAIEKLSV